MDEMQDEFLSNRGTLKKYEDEHGGASAYFGGDTCNVVTISGSPLDILEQIFVRFRAKVTVDFCRQWVFSDKNHK